MSYDENDFTRLHKSGMRTYAVRIGASLCLLATLLPAGCGGRESAQLLSAATSKSDNDCSLYHSKTQNSSCFPAIPGTVDPASSDSWPASSTNIGHVSTATAVQGLSGPAPIAKNLEARRSQLAEAYGKLPLSFEVNQGQTNDQVKFLSRGTGYYLFLTSSEAVLSLRKPQQQQMRRIGRSMPGTKGRQTRESVPAVVRMKLVGANANPNVTGDDELPGSTNYFIGNDPSKWRAHIPNYAKVRFRSVYPGVDLVYYGNQRQLEYDLVVAPGADPHTIRFTVEGADKVKLDARGDLLLRIADDNVRFRKPVIYQQVDGQRRAIAGRYALLNKHQVGFELAAYDSRFPLVIDPVLVYSTYLGGSGGYDIANGIAADSSGNAYVVGQINPPDFPVTPGAFQPTSAASETAFVTEINASGTALVYSTYLGGSSGENGAGIAVDSSGDAYVTGYTASTDFPTTPGAYQATWPSGTTSSSHTFVTKLNSTGSALVYSTFLDGTYTSTAAGIALDLSGDAYVTGYTQSADFPTTPGAYQTVLGESGSAFVTQLNPAGSGLVYSTFLGSNDQGTAIAVDSSGDAYVTGATVSPNFPTTPGAFQTTYTGVAGQGNGDAFVTKFNSTGTALVYSTYLAGSGPNGDFAYAIAVDSFDDAYVTGWTSSTDFPITPAAFQTSFGPVVTCGTAPNTYFCYRAFVTEINPSGSALVYSTYLGGNGLDGDGGDGIAVDASGDAYVTGWTSSTDFPVTATAFQTTYADSAAGANGNNVFVTELNSTGTALVYSTYLGGSGPYGDAPFGLAIDSLGGVYVVGSASSPDFPTMNPIQANYPAGNSQTGFVAKLSLGPPTQTQTITFNPLSNQPFGAAPFTVSATATSGLPVSFASTTTSVCTVSGTTVTLVSAGTCTIQATQAGNATYPPATPVNQSFQVAQANQTITFGILSSVTFSASPYALSATATSGLPVSFASTTPSVCAVSGATVMLLSGGVCTVEATQAGNTSYAAAAPVDQSFQVMQASQTITFGPLLNEMLGAAPFTVAATASSGLSVSFASTTASTCTVTGSTVTLVAGGTCIIEATQTGNPSYAAATPVDQSFQVTQGIQTIAFGPLPNEVLGAAPFTVNATAGSGLPVSFTSTTTSICTVSGSTVALAAAGLCTIQASQAGSASYAPAPAVNQSFEVVAPGLGTNALLVGSATGSSSVLLTYGGAWTASSNASFLHVSPTSASGTGSAVVVFTYDAFTSTGSRTGTLTVAGFTLTVTQAGTNYLGPGPQIGLVQTGLNSPSGIAVDGSGNIYIADTGNNAIEEWSAATQLVTTLVSTGLSSPHGVAVDSSGNVYIADFGNNAIKEWSAATQQVTNLVSAGLSEPSDVAVDSSGNVYIADTANNAIKEWSATTQQVTTLITEPQGSPTAVAVDCTGNVYFVDYGSQLKELSPGMQDAGLLGGQVFNSVSGLAVDGSGNVYTVDPVDNVILMWSPSTGNFTTPAAVFPIGTRGLAVDGAGDLYTVNSGASLIAEIPNAYVGPASVTEPIAAGSDSLLPMLPATQSLTGVFAPGSNANWLNIDGIADGVVNFSFSANTSTERTTTIGVLGHGITVTQNGLTPQSITFSALSNQSYGTAPFALGATATSGLTVSFTSQTASACTVSGATLTLVGAGTCTIQATQAGNGTYAAATPVSQSFQVTQASQTITFNALSNQVFGAAPLGLNATASSGLTVNFTSTTTPVCTVSGASVTIIAAGTCTIQAEQSGNLNYAPAAVVIQSFQVTPASQIITFGALSNQVFGNSPVRLSATATSGLTVGFNSTTPSVCTVSGTFATLVAVGTCTIQATQAGNTNYTAAAPINQSFQVAQASQSITFGTLSNETFGTAPFAISATASSGLPVSFASTTTSVCTVSRTTETLLEVGKCTIRATQAGNTNYAAASPLNQNFQVTQESQTITFGALSNEPYGTAPFTVSATASSGLTVSFASTTTAVCTVSGSTITLKAAGTCTIQATQAGNANYVAATPVGESFQVTQEGQTITFGALSNQTYGASAFTISATASSGLAVSFASLTTSICTVSGSKVTLVGAGTCTIQATQAGNTNYAAATPVSQSFQVMQASQSIAFGTIANKTFGAAPFTVSATATSGLPVSFASTTTPVCTVTGSTVTIVSAGTCTIQATQAGNANFAAATPVSQSFQIAQANQTITFATLSNQVLGIAPFTASATASSGLPVSFASTTTSVCTVAGSTVTIVAAGTCTVQATQAGNSDYTAAAPVNRNFKVAAQATFVATGGLTTARYDHTATMLTNGEVLIAGGYNGSYLASAELYNPSSGTFAVTSGSLNTARYDHTATILNNGMVLIVGGYGSSGYLASAELYNPATETFTATGSMTYARDGHTATLLSNGMVLIAGGYGPISGFSGTSYGELNSAELYNPATGTFAVTTGSLNTAREYHTATLLNSLMVLIAGGDGSSGYLASAELYNPATETFVVTNSSLATSRSAHTATLLTNGEVLIAGGYNGSYLASAELYNPATGTFAVTTGSLNTAREYHTATLLNSGMVLIAGGYGSSGYLASAELYNPATETFAVTGGLATARYEHTATLLSNGEVLVAGGVGASGILASAQLY